jgi:NAD(P)-dependent dehydrogenase (short-subunit alcohol dehydrogenase family)
MGRLDGKVAIITGASRGIGAASAKAFAAAGARVVLAARSGKDLAAVVDEIRTAGGDGIAFETDVSDEESVKGLIAAAVKKYGRLDYAFNNAADHHALTPLADIATADFDHTVAVSLRGVFLAMKYEIPEMLKAGGGAIVNMSSTAGVAAGNAGLSSYVAAKHGVIGLTKAAALDYADKGIRVNALMPGPIFTRPEMEAANVGQWVPMKRMGRPEEVAAVAVWLCSDEAAYITGASIPIDGGKLARSA